VTDILPRKIIDEIVSSGVVAIDPLRGKSGIQGLGIATGNKFFYIPKQQWWDEFIAELVASRLEITCFNIRRIVDIIPSERLVYDVRLIPGKFLGSLSELMSMKLSNARETRLLVETEERISAHIRAARTAQIDPD
jgi:hypothetical protein